MGFDVSIFIITQDRQYIPVDEFINELDGEGTFVMLTNDKLNQDYRDDNSICIYKDWVNALNETYDELELDIKFCIRDGFVECPWQMEQKEIPNTFKLNEYTEPIGSLNFSARVEYMRKYLDGYRTNQEIMKNVVSLLKGRTAESYIPAIMVVHHTKICFNGRVIHGYLPAIGQLLFINDNIEMLNMSLIKITKQDNLFKVRDNDRLMKGTWWSVTECDSHLTWTLSNGLIGGGSKTIPWYVLPLFSL